MHRLLLVATVVSAAACTTESPTDTGTLVGMKDQVFECQETAGGAFTCSLEVAIADGQLTALGRYEDGSTGPTATATINDAARLRISDLVAHIPLDSSDTVHDVGCGVAPSRVTNANLVFDHDGERTFNIEYVSQGPMADFSVYLHDLATGIRNCSSSELTFDSCQPNLF
jgi:hypothetical protein